METVEYKNISFTVWDVGGQDKIRPLWRHYSAMRIHKQHIVVQSEHCFINEMHVKYKLDQSDPNNY